MKVGRKRFCAALVTYFKAPIRNENYIFHRKGLHSEKWAELIKLDEASRNAFFNSDCPESSQATLHAFCGPCSRPLIF